MLLLAVLRGAMGKGNKQGILRIVVAFVFKGAEDFHSQLPRTMLGSLRPNTSQYTSPGLTAVEDTCSSVQVRTPTFL